MVVLDRENIYFQAEHILNNYSYEDLTLEKMYDVPYYEPIDIYNEFLDFDRLRHIRECIFILHDVRYRDLTQNDQIKVLKQKENFMLLSPILDHFADYLKLKEPADMIGALMDWKKMLSSIMFQQIDMNKWMLQTITPEEEAEQKYNVELREARKSIIQQRNRIFEEAEINAKINQSNGQTFTGGIQSDEENK